MVRYNINAPKVKKPFRPSVYYLRRFSEKGQPPGQEEQQRICPGSYANPRIRDNNNGSYCIVHDQLTGLFNRTYFLEELRIRDTERDLPISLLMGDISGLKLVNDAYSYQEGDRLLIEFARVLNHCCGENAIISRWGGDEFAVFMPGTPQKEAAELSRCIKEACKSVPRHSIELFISMGRATKENNFQDIFEVLKKAEADMHRQKLAGSKDYCKSLITSLVGTLGEKDYETEVHTWRMQKMAIELGSEFGLNDSQLEELVLAVTLHDIGKIAIPEQILMKKRSLTDGEWELIKEHSARGYRIALSSNELAGVAPYVLSHHERWDGKGYPQGLKQEEIPLISRILSIVDAFDVMSHGRPYKKRLSRAQVVEELQKCAGSQFDPQLVHTFVKCLLKA